MTGPVTPNPGPIPPHRLTGDQCLEIAKSVPRLAEYHVLTRQLIVRGIDNASFWVEDFLTLSERVAIRAGIERTAPRV